MLNYCHRYFAPRLVGLLTCCALFVVVGCSSDEPETQTSAQTQTTTPAPETANQMTTSITDSASMKKDSSKEMAQNATPTKQPTKSSAESSEPATSMPKHERLTPEYGTYTVQIGSYDSREAAMPFMKKLQADGLDPYLIDEMVSTGGSDHLVYRLRFGKYETKDEAHSRGSEVALKYKLDYWVDNYRQ